MAERVQTYETRTELIQSAPQVVDAGAGITLKVKVTCPSACDLHGLKVRVIAEDSTLVGEAELAGFEEESFTTDEFIVKAPAKLGPCTWAVVFPAQEVGEVPVEASSTPLTFHVKAHSSSIVVWDVPLPVMMASPFTLKLGVRCSAGCSLDGENIEVYDEIGMHMVTATLGKTPWPETTGLYWAEARLTAPATEGVHSWTAKFPEPGLELPHEEGSTSFSFRTARSPEHTVTVEVTDANVKTPIKDARVYLHPYSGYTDARGLASVGVIKGKHELWVIAMDYAEFERDINVTADMDIKVELRPPNTQW